MISSAPASVSTVTMASLSTTPVARSSALEYLRTQQSVSAPPGSRFVKHGDARRTADAGAPLSFRGPGVSGAIS